MVVLPYCLVSHTHRQHKRIKWNICMVEIVHIGHRTLLQALPHLWLGISFFILSHTFKWWVLSVLSSLQVPQHKLTNLNHVGFSPCQRDTIGHKAQCLYGSPKPTIQSITLQLFTLWKRCVSEGTLHAKRLTCTGWIFHCWIIDLKYAIFSGEMGEWRSFSTRICSVSSWIRRIAGSCVLISLGLCFPRLSRSSTGLFEDHGRRRTQWWSRFTCLRGLPVAPSTSMIVQGSVKGSAQPAQSPGDGSFFNSPIRKFWSFADFLRRFERIWRVSQSHGLVTYHWWTFFIVCAPCQHISIHRPSNRVGNTPSTGFWLR